MGCSTCGKKAYVNRSPGSVLSAKHQVAENIGVCEYSNEMLISFRDNLIYFKDSGLYTKYKILPKTMNKYLGIVLISINIANKCMYRDQLEKISDLNDLIISVKP